MLYKGGNMLNLSEFSRNNHPYMVKLLAKKIVDVEFG
jgi:hypothetical protein